MSVAAVELPAPSPARPRLRVLPSEPPRTRGDCIGGPRPCPWACRHNLTVERGWRPGRPSCALDVADQGGLTLAQIGELLGVSRERIRQIQKQAVENLAEGLRLAGVLTSREAWRVPAAVRAALSP
jgi:Sigma-70, region 4